MDKHDFFIIKNIKHVSRFQFKLLLNHTKKTKFTESVCFFTVTLLILNQICRVINAFMHIHVQR